MEVSLVIPTYRRETNLFRLLKSIELQTSLPNEVFIVIPVDSHFNEDLLDKFRPQLNINLLRSELGVCFQRNMGIKSAKNIFVLLCDDDMVLQKDYLSILLNHIEQQPNLQICSGQFLDIVNSSWTSSFSPKTWLNLYYKKIFHHGLWSTIEDLEELKGPKFILKPLINHYKSKGNTCSKAGWPYFVKQNDEVSQTRFYSLGASLCRKSFLLKHPFDEVLDPSGIGDNYGVALQMNSEMGIHVIKKAKAYHYRSNKNRIKNSKAYFLRVLAMDYFNKKYASQTSVKKGELIWSIFGNLLSRLFSLQFSMAYSSAKAIIYLLFNKNPYVEYSAKGLKSCMI